MILACKVVFLPIPILIVKFTSLIVKPGSLSLSKKLIRCFKFVYRNVRYLIKIKFIGK